MNRRKENEIKGIFGLVVLVFLIFLLIPLVRLFLKSFMGDAGLTLGHYTEVLTGRGFLQAFGNSLLISSVSAVVTTVLAFILAYAVHYCNLPRQYKGFINRAAVAPMLLPTITYGFAIIYSFGKQGLITQMVGTQLFDIYGFNGLLLGYVIYTLPVSFLLQLSCIGCRLCGSGWQKEGSGRSSGRQCCCAQTLFWLLPTINIKIIPCHTNLGSPPGGYDN